MRSNPVLSHPRRQFLELCLRLEFGRIERLIVRHGEPDFEPWPRVIRNIKLCPGNNERRRPLTVADLAATPEVRALFGYFDRIEDSAVDLIEVQNGKPFLVELIATLVTPDLLRLLRR